MKKFLCFLSALAMISLTAAGCARKEKNGDVTLRVNEVTDSIFYAPFYVAIEKGFYKDEGINIDLVNGAGSDVSMTALLSKNADIALLGPETTVYVARQKKADQPKLFAQLTKRDGCFLLSRTPEPDFKWENLKGKEVIIGRLGGLPAMTFEYTVNNLGLKDGENVTLRKDIQFPLMGPTFDGGTGDYVTLFEPTASEFVKAGKGHIVASVGSFSGEVPYTGFAALESYINKNPETIEKFLRATYKAINYVKTADIDEVSAALHKHFSSTDLSSVKSALKNYIANDTWVDNMAMTADSFTRLTDIIKNAGENVDGVAFNDVVRTDLAEKIYKEVNG